MLLFDRDGISGNGLLGALCSPCMKILVAPFTS